MYAGRQARERFAGAVVPMSRIVAPATERAYPSGSGASPGGRDLDEESARRRQRAADIERHVAAVRPDHDRRGLAPSTWQFSASPTERMLWLPRVRPVERCRSRPGSTNAGAAVDVTMKPSLSTIGAVGADEDGDQAVGGNADEGVSSQPAASGQDVASGTRRGGVVDT